MGLLKIRSCNCVAWIDFQWASYTLSGKVFLHCTWAQGFSAGNLWNLFLGFWTQACLSPTSTLPELLQSLQYDGHLSCAHLFFFSGQFFLAGQKQNTNSSASTPKRLRQISSSHLKPPSGPVLWPLSVEPTKPLLPIVLFLALGPLLAISRAEASIFYWHSGSFSTPILESFSLQQATHVISTLLPCFSGAPSFPSYGKKGRVRFH